MSRFPVKIVFSQSTERIRGRTLLCFRKSLLSKNVRDKRGVCSDFPSNLFCLTVPINFVRESLCNSGKLRYRKKLWIRRGRKGVSRLSVEHFCLTIPKRFAEEPFCVSEKCISKIFRQERWILLFLVRNRLSHSTDELLIGTRPRFRNFWLSK